MSGERKSNVEVEVIDGERLCEAIQPKIEGLPPNARLRLGWGYALVRTPKGTFVLDNDGCGNRLPVEQEPAEVEITRADQMLAGCPWSIKITAENVKDIPVCGKINLAAFIRVFGSRLEDNFNMWNRFLEGILKG